MERLEMKLILVTEEVKKLKELEKQNDYFVVKDICHYAVGCARERYDLCTAKIEILPTKGNSYENAIKLLIGLKEFKNKDTLPLDG
ncbi:MAG: hypothetical protein Q8O03_04020 [Nanoarchaeota archaeon]|nr:hypothetical protein [Nanoarchaeota archaeon]